MKRVALFVGIDSYESKEINDLRCAERDAIDLHAFFQFAGGYNDTRYLLRPDTGKIISEIREMLRDLSDGDQFLFYFAGHGTEHNGKHLLLDVNAERDLLPFNQHVLPVEMLKILTARPRLNRVFMLDCCRNDLFAGRGAGEGLKDSAGWRNIAAAPEQSDIEEGSLTIICSCDEGRQALEIENQGLFTASFLHHLKEAKNSGAGVALNDEFESLLRKNMSERASTHGMAVQRPWIQRSGEVVSLFGDALPSTKPSPEPVVGTTVVCPYCGLRNNEDETFDCRICGRKHLCMEHYVKSARCCSECVQYKELDCGGGVKLKVKRIVAGSFMMGSENNSFEQPAHPVTLKNPFYMGVYSVTQAQYIAVMGENPSASSDKPAAGNLPAECVSWEDAREFCRKLSELSGERVELPSEALWEYCCRAGATGDYAGSLGFMGWYDSNSECQTHPVGGKRPNAWGLYDMHGNVWEWCRDKWCDDYNEAPADGSARLDVNNSDRVIRGGCYFDVAGECRSASRSRNAPSDKCPVIGFRICLVSKVQ